MKQLNVESKVDIKGLLQLVDCLMETYMTQESYLHTM